MLDTLVQPPRLPPGKRLRTICLDAGHGGKEPGQKSGARLEKQYTLALAQELRALLVDAGFTVVMTRRTDTYVDLAERPAIASRNSADLFISLHYNASADGGSEASGTEVYAMTPEGAKSTNVSADVGSLRAWAGNDFDRENVFLAYHMQRLPPGSDCRARWIGVCWARFFVLRLAEMPAILIEGGFMSNAVMPAGFTATPAGAAWPRPSWKAFSRTSARLNVVPGLRATPVPRRQPAGLHPARRGIESSSSRRLAVESRQSPRWGFQVGSSGDPPRDRGGPGTPESRRSARWPPGCSARDRVHGGHGRRVSGRWR